MPALGKLIGGARSWRGTSDRWMRANAPLNGPSRLHVPAVSRRGTEAAAELQTEIAIDGRAARGANRRMAVEVIWAIKVLPPPSATVARKPSAQRR